MQNSSGLPFITQPKQLQEDLSLISNSELHCGVHVGPLPWGEA
jgi:hypothetical protein